MSNNAWLTTVQAAEVTGYARDHVRRLAASGAVKAKKIGRDWHINRASLLEYVKRVEKLGEKRGPKTSK